VLDNLKVGLHIPATPSVREYKEDIFLPFIDSLWLLTNLGEEVELDHSVGERVGIGAEVGNHAQHGAVEGPVDLLEARLTRVVHVHHGHVPQEPARQNT
jgi:hypothetical protein